MRARVVVESSTSVKAASGDVVVTVKKCGECSGRTWWREIVIFGTMVVVVSLKRWLR